ncbi:MAG: gliding motility-associated C-terminal domain-containing protein [Lentimicrobiaceae bacterium]|nr:gliding motility-associated C-terminal domain-containing protein [Lentimicrobiaceae bacterium]
MKKNLAVALFMVILGSPLLSLSQNRCSYVTPRQTDNWYFFQNAGIKFTDGSVNANNLPGNNLTSGNGTATFSDENGNLLIYSDGMKVWNSNHNEINFGPNLAGDAGATQAALIVQRPTLNQILYIFTTDLLLPAPLGTDGFNYAKVDMTANNGAGAVLERQNHLLDQSSVMLTGVANAAQNGYWVVTHGAGNNAFYAFEVTAAGVNTDAVISNVGAVLDTDYSKSELIGAMKISPKGDKIAYASMGKQHIELFSFDNATGRVSNALTLNPPITNPGQGAYYVEFSPDGSMLYTVVANLNTGRDNHLYQYDLNNGNAITEINTSPMAVDVSAIQLGRNGKIYVARKGSAYLGVIENPNRPGIACNYNENGLSIASKTGLLGLPNFVQSYFDIPPFDYDTKCDGDETVFTLLNTSNIDQATWNFGDPDSGAENTATGLSPTHVFSAPGIYTVTLTESFNGQQFVSTQEVLINNLPLKVFKSQDIDTMFLFPGSAIPLWGPDDMFEYVWQDGSTLNSYSVTDPGEYWVEYTDINCCTNRDSLYIKLLDIALPTAFRPTSNVPANQVFKPLGPSEGIENYSFTIHDRWGQQVFTTNTFGEVWDGKIKGEIAPQDIYAWYMTFNVKGNVSELGKVKYKGHVMLLK